MGIRVNKYIASSGFCSRREADRLVESGKVTVDDITAVNGTIVGENSVVRVNGVEVLPQDNHIYIALHKPLGITCTTDKKDPTNIIDYIGMDERIFNIGRLDKNSSGLILLTNDGDIVNKLLRAEFGHEKEYQVRVEQKLKPDFKNKMESGIYLKDLDRTTLPCEVTITSAHTFRIILKQGLNRQIRRMCEELGYRVTKLRRTRFMNIELGDLPYGKYRELTPSEVKQLKSMVKMN